MEELLYLDHQVFIYLNNLGNSSWDGFWNFITNKWTSIPLYGFFVFLLFKSFGWKTVVSALLLIAVMITLTDQLSNLFKDGFQRLRPCRQEGVMEYTRFVAVRCGVYGYFSAHAASSTALVVFLGSLFKSRYPRVVIGLIIWGLMVSYSRIYVGVHYPSDVLTGMILGSGIGYLLYRVHGLGLEHRINWKLNLKPIVSKGD